ncbi:MAG: hypothetical protein MK132_12305 [Lentisphaerales bacterium]|nr:hypothetical protein [Lentisphaerales bacterium]
MKTKLIIIVSCLWAAYNLKAEITSISQPLKNWPALTLQNEVTPPEKDMIEFKETDFKAIEKKVVAQNQPMIPLNTKRQFTELVTLSNPDIKWRVFMTAFTSNHYSGFSQGFGGTTMLLEDELFLDVEVEQIQIHGDDDRYYKNWDGDKYRINTMMHWYPTDNFSLHLGFNGWVDK